MSDKSMLNAYSPGHFDNLPAESQRSIARREALLGPAYRLFYENPLHIVRGDGVWLFDSGGRAYLDAYNNVASVGHCRPEVVAAISAQAGILNTHTRYLHDGILDYAERLTATLPDELSRVMFTCTGSEANDLAFRIAQSYTGGTGVIVTQLAYHGVTSAISSMSPSLGGGVALGASVRTVAPPDSYRGEPEPAAGGARFGIGVQAAIDDMRRHGIKPAALLVDTIFSSDGVFTDPVGCLAPAVKAIRDAGGVFIADEVQAGFARTGSCMWGFERHGLVPDIVTMGKPMGNGHPVAGLAVKPEVVDKFGRQSRYFNTFGGNPVSCAAALATLDVIQSEKLQQNAATVGEYLRGKLRNLAGRHGLIGDVRGDGLFIGVELVLDRATLVPAKAETARLVNLMRENGVLISATGVHGNVLKLRPPLVFNQANADRLLVAVDEALAAL